MLIKYLLNGKEVNLTGDEVTIKSTNFNVDKDGNMSCNNANITGGIINLAAKQGDIRLKVFNQNDKNSNTSITSGSVEIFDASYTDLPLVLIGTTESNKISGDIRLINNYNDGEETKIHTWGIDTPTINQTSLKTKKKNIEKLNIDAIELIKKADICSYNFKTEDNTAKKHIGLIIGEGYNCPDIVISKDGQGIEQYSYTTLLYKGIQQLLTRIEKLEQEVQNEKDNI